MHFSFIFFQNSGPFDPRSYVVWGLMASQGKQVRGDGSDKRLLKIPRQDKQGRARRPARYQQGPTLEPGQGSGLVAEYPVAVGRNPGGPGPEYIFWLWGHGPPPHWGKEPELVQET